MTHEEMTARSDMAACSTSSRRRRLSYARCESSSQRSSSTQARGRRTGGVTGGERRLARHGGATETRSCGQRRVILRQNMIGTGALHQWTCAKHAFEPRVALNWSANRPSSCKLAMRALQISSKEGEGQREKPHWQAQLRAPLATAPCAATPVQAQLNSDAVPGHG